MDDGSDPWNPEHPTDRSADPRSPGSGSLFGAVRRLVLGAAAVVVAGWIVVLALWLAFRLLDW